MLTAEIVSVGTELLLGEITDTDAPALARTLSEFGVAVYRRTTIGDNHDRLLAALRGALAANDVIFTIGGLGPTMDDITRDVLAEAMGDPLRRDEAIAERLRRFFEERGLAMLDSNLRQAMVPVRGRPIDNPNGTAPGLLFEDGGMAAIAMPGPPAEFLPMLRDSVRPWLEERTRGGPRLRSRVLRIIGVGESAVEDQVKDLMLDSNPTVAPYAKLGEVHLRVTASGSDEAATRALIDKRVRELRERLGDAIYGEGDAPLEAAIVDMLRAAGRTIATAESCTGGLLSKRITDVPGSSDVFPGGVVSYSNAAKERFLGVRHETLAAHGAVSVETAREMAAGARDAFGADVGVGITGVAGPGGGSPEKPVGLVYVAVADSSGVEVEECRILGERETVRYRSAQTALLMVRRRLLAG